MEKKSRRSLVEAAYNNETVIIELSNGLKWEAQLLPISSLIELNDGIFIEVYYDTLQPTVALIASYGGQNSEIT